MAASSKSEEEVGLGGIDASELPGRDVAEWVRKQAKKELARVLEFPGQHAISVPVNNTALMHERSGPKKGDVCVVNRVECATRFDFSKIGQILVSPHVPCPLKRGFSYVNVILVPQQPKSPKSVPGDGSKKNKPVVTLIVPYLYDASIPGNTLEEWVFINNKAERTRLKVGLGQVVGSRK